MGRLIQQKVLKNPEAAFERIRRGVTNGLFVKPGQEVYRRNFVLSDFGKSFNAKFATKFLKDRVVSGNNAYEVEDLQTSSAS